MTGLLLYERLRDANLVAPIMTDAEVVAMIERVEAEESLQPSAQSQRLARAVLGALATEESVQEKAVEIEQDQRDIQNQAQHRYLYELRHQFAMAALTGYLSASQGSDCTPGEILHDCYRLADAALEACK